MKIVTVVGARPQFIKAAAVSREIERENKNSGENSHIREVIVHTGQHYDRNMSDIFFQEMQIPKPDYHMNISGRSHAAMTGEILVMVESVLEKEKPDLVLVYGDTNTTLSAALSACKIHIPVAHIEAGLRSYNKYMPEEVNRILTDQISSILFCPTVQAVSNLKAEGFPDPLLGSDQQRGLLLRYGSRPFVIKCGDVMQDAAIFYADISRNTSTIMHQLPVHPGEYILSTIHRAENTDDSNRLNQLVTALSLIAQTVPIVIPMHPRTRKILIQKGISFSGQDVHVIEPVGYFDMIELIRNCRIVMTDSGGLQKEAYIFGRPCVTLRNETEWVELVQGGYNILAGCDPDVICNCVEKQLQGKIAKHVNLYGDGKASKRIVHFLKNLLVR